jgi:glucose/arabinose dehydrogenase
MSIRLIGGFVRCLAMVALLVGGAPPAARAVDITLTPFAHGLSFPTDIVSAGDGRLFVIEKSGHIKVVMADGSVLGPDFLDLSALVSGGSEQGLLGLAFHPQYASNGLFYVYYTDLAGNIAIVRYSAAGDPTTSNTADPTSAFSILGIAHPFANHNGGDLIFGPDGYLYLGTGDGGASCDPADRAQNPAELLGKMLRIDVDSGAPYAIPPTNPFAGSLTARPEIWALGLRNPFRFSFDRANGNLFIADVGQNAIEEIDVQPASSTGGENYGWDCYEGDSLASASSGCTTMATCVPASQFVFPVYQYDHSGGRCAVTGGYVYRGSQSPGIVGHYFFADYCSSNFYGLTTPDNGVTWNVESFGVPVSGLNPTTFGEGADGEVYVGGQSSDTIYHITAAVAPPTCAVPAATGCIASPKSRLTLKRPANTQKNRLTWKWLTGPALSQSDFGDPVGGGTSYALCIYAGTGAAAVTAAIPGGSGWKALSTKGYTFKDRNAGGDGVFRARLQGGADGKSRLLVKAKGANLDLGALPLDQTADVRVQLTRDDTPVCWEAVFPPAAIHLNDPTGFKATVP